MSRSGCACVSGFTLIELILGMALGSVVLLAAMALLLISRAEFQLEDEQARLQETGQYSLSVLSRALRHSGPFSSSDAQSAPFLAVQGLDAVSLKDSVAALESPVAGGINGSDALAVLVGGNGVDSVFTCDGATVTPTDAAPAWNIFFLARSDKGEPELRCKYLSQQGDRWDAEALASGVENFQVLYGIDTAGDGLVHRYVNATTLNGLRVAGATAAVVAVRIALLVRGGMTSGAFATARSFHLFGPAYSAIAGSADPGVMFNGDGEKAASVRLRSLFHKTVYLRRRAVAGPGATGAGNATAGA